MCSLSLVSDMEKAQLLKMMWNIDAIILVSVSVRSTHDL